MKIIKKFSLCLLMTFLIFSFTGCKLNDGGTTVPTQPVNFKIQNGVASWDAVSGIDGYKLSVDDVTRNVTTTSYNLTTLDLFVGSHTVKVASFIGDQVSIYTSVLTFIVEQTVINMIETPQNIILNGKILSWDIVSNALSYTIMVGDIVIEDVYTTSVDLSNLDLYAGDYSVRVIAKRGNISSLISSSLNYVIDPVAYDDIYSEILKLISPDYEPGMNDSDFDYDYEYNNYLGHSQLAQIYASSTSNMMMSKENAVGLIQHFIDIFDSEEEYSTFNELKIELDRFNTFGLSTNKLVDLMISLGDGVLNILNIQANNGEIDPPEAALLISKLQDILGDDEILVRANLTNTINFATDLYGQLNSNMLIYLNKLYTNSNLKGTEIFLLKDEMVGALQATLPDVESIEQFYQLVMLIGTSFAGPSMDLDNISNMLDYSTSLSILTNTSTSLLLDLVSEFTLDDMVDFNYYFEEIVTQEKSFCGYHFDGEVLIEEYCYKDKVDFIKALDAILYVQDYVKEFYQSHQTQFEMLGMFPLRDFVIDVVFIAADVAKVQLAANMSPEEYEDVSLMIDMALDEVETLLDGIEVLANLGIDEMDLFFTSNGQMFYDIYDLIIKFNDDGDIIELIQASKNVIDQFILYNGIIIENLTPENLEKLMLMVKTPFIVLIGMEDMGFDFDTSDTLFNELIDPLTTFTYNLLILESSLVTTINNYDVSSHFIGDDFDIEQRAIETAILVLGQFLTDNAEAEDIIFDNVEMLFTYILNNPILSEMVTFDLDEIRLEVENTLEYFIDEIEFIYNFDFDSNPENEYYDRIDSFLFMFAES